MTDRRLRLCTDLSERVKLAAGTLTRHLGEMVIGLGLGVIASSVIAAWLPTIPPRTSLLLVAWMWVGGSLLIIAGRSVSDHMFKRRVQEMRR